MMLIKLFHLGQTDTEEALSHLMELNLNFKNCTYNFMSVWLP